MRFFLARIFYVLFCIGGMVGLSLVVKYAINSMEPLFLYGFLTGMFFLGAVVSLCFWLDKRERQIL